MKKKLCGALSLVLCALMLLAPVTGANAGNSIYDLWEEQSTSYNRDLYTDGLTSFKGTGYSGGSIIIQYWDERYGSGEATVGGPFYLKYDEGCLVAQIDREPTPEFWRFVGLSAVVSDDSHYIVHLEAVGPTVEGYPKKEGSYKLLYLFEGVNSWKTDFYYTRPTYNQKDYLPVPAALIEKSPARCCG